jgi:elongation factor 1-gamma
LQYTPPPKEKKEKAPPAPAQPKAEKKPKKEDDDEDDDDKPYEEAPKEKNPLDLLPKSTFNLEDWKRAYSNKDTRGAGGSLEWFYQKFVPLLVFCLELIVTPHSFDKEGFSIWRVDFKYNEELTQTFMSSNQIGGFFNRLEASRKYLFGSVGVLGTSNDSIITGALVARGPEIKPVVEVAPDWESYTYERVNLDNAEQKAFFEAALAWDLEVGDKKWVDGKNVSCAFFGRIFGC